MSAELILFFFLALVAVVSAVAMLVAHNPVYSAIYLILNFSTIAVFYLLLSAPFIAMAQITVYAGAIMVLFVFVIMLLGGELVTTRSTILWQTPLAVILGLVLIIEIAYILVVGDPGAPPTLTGQAGALPADFGSPSSVGGALFNQFLLPFEVTSIILLVAMIGAIVLTRVEKTQKKETRQEP